MVVPVRGRSRRRGGRNARNRARSGRFEVELDNTTNSLGGRKMEMCCFFSGIIIGFLLLTALVLSFHGNGRSSALAFWIQVATEISQRKLDEFKDYWSFYEDKVNARLATLGDIFESHYRAISMYFGTSVADSSSEVQEGNGIGAVQDYTSFADMLLSKIVQTIFDCTWTDKRDNCPIQLPSAMNIIGTSLSIFIFVKIHRRIRNAEEQYRRINEEETRIRRYIELAFQNRSPDFVMVLGDDRPVPEPLSYARINRFPTVLLNEQERDGKICSICLDSFPSRRATKLDCEHYFHKKCIETWFRRTGTCPVCRRGYSND